MPLDAAGTARAEIDAARKTAAEGAAREAREVRERKAREGSPAPEKRIVDLSPSAALVQVHNAYSRYLTAPDEMEAEAVALLREAETQVEEARAPLEPGQFVVGVGGEPLPADESGDTLMQNDARNPNKIAFEASEARLRLAHACLPIALDFAEAVKASNSMERALCQQAALGHTLAMKLGDRALAFARAAEWDGYSEGLRNVNAGLAAKTGNVFARVMEANARVLNALQAAKGAPAPARVVEQRITVVRQVVVADRNGRTIDAEATHEAALDELR